MRDVLKMTRSLGGLLDTSAVLAWHVDMMLLIGPNQVRAASQRRPSRINERVLEMGAIMASADLGLSLFSLSLSHPNC